MSVPIAQTAAFGCDDLGVLADIQSGARKGYQYTRIANPTTHAWESEVAALEGGESAHAFASGMAAVAGVLMSELSAGDHLVVSERVYGVTHALITQTLARFAVSATFVDVADVSAVEAAFTEKTRGIYAETFSNPTLQVAPIEALASLAKRRRVPLMIDNTFATPTSVRPLSLGADIVLHSATKYLNGHSDVSAGVVIASRAVISRMQKTAWLLGATLDPMASWLLLRGLKTLSLRMRQQCENARIVAGALAKDSRVRRVYAVSGCAVVSFEPVPQDGETLLMAATRVSAALEHVPVVPSLGGVSTTITSPAMTSHRSVPKIDRERLGVSDGLLRLSIGCEDAGDLCKELEAAL
jgi:cystathionine beta-lyase/cystathionine gamma-synthase